MYVSSVVAAPRFAVSITTNVTTVAVAIANSSIARGAVAARNGDVTSFVPVESIATRDR